MTAFRYSPALSVKRIHLSDSKLLVVGVEVFAVFKLVHGAAIRALGLAAAAHIQIHLGVGVPSLHLCQRAWAKNAALMVQVFHGEFNLHLAHIHTLSDFG